ncbi:MAG: DUF357 domain-containing protein [Candidatus Bathyarchaeia archaeon]|nr:DUF357 domain-containing protein [Candidatus Bathyarchaeota archaeon]
MSLEQLVARYIASAERVLSELQITVKDDVLCLPRKAILEVIDLAKAYLHDAKYYRNRKRFDVGLASVAYCEGLLDALRILGAVRFEWPTRKEGNT